jgi:hypothetical protein
MTKLLAGHEKHLAGRDEHENAADRDRGARKRAYAPPRVERRRSLDRSILFSGSATAGTTGTGSGTALTGTAD